MAQNNQVNSPFPTAITKGGTGVTSVTSAPTASAWAGWDANKNLSAVGFIPGYTTTVTSASPVTLTVGSNQNQYFTGSTAQTLVMPVASTLVVGQYWNIVNNSSAAITINSSGGNLILSLPASSETIVTCVLASGTTAASWTTSPAVSGSGTVNSGLINQVAWYAASGTAVSGLSIVNSAVLTTTSLGVPTWVASTGTNAPVLGTAPTISSPKIDQINDQTNNGKVISFSGSVSAVNYTNFVNAPTGQTIGLQFIGSDSNVNANFVTKGTGTISFNNGFAVSTQPLFTITGSATNTVNGVTLTGTLTTVSPTIAATGTDSNIILTIQGKGTGGVNLLGTSTNNNAAAGYVGEFISSVISSGAPVSFSSGISKDLTSISLTAGDWDVWGNVIITTGGALTTFQCWTSTTSATPPDTSLKVFTSAGALTACGLSAPYARYNLSATTTIYISAASAGTGTLVGQGGIYARRAR